jgi:protein-disulfide isomerase
VLDVRMTPTLFVNGLRWVGEPEEDVLESLIQRERRAVGWLLAQGTASERAYALRVRRNLIDVEDGAPDRTCVPRGDAPALGPEDALVTLVEFSGFECAACRDLEAAIRSVMGRHPNQIRRSFRGLAPRQAAPARRVAAFALSAQTALGDPAFWSLYRALRAAPLGLDDAALLAIAKGVGLDGQRLLASAGDDANERRLNHDLELAVELNVPQSPTLFVNGRLLSKELSAEKLEAVVSEELAIARRIARAGTPPSHFDELLCRAR